MLNCGSDRNLAVRLLNKQIIPKMVTKVFCLSLRTNALVVGWLYTVLSALGLIFGIIVLVMQENVKVWLVENYPEIDHESLHFFQSLITGEFHVKLIQRIQRIISIFYFEVMGIVVIVITAVSLSSAILLLIGVHMVSARKSFFCRL